MKVIYYTNPFFADCDFPLIKELQDKGIDVRVYMPINNKFRSSSIIEFDKPFTKWGLIKASKIKEMDIYSDCLDLDRLYLICGQRNRLWWPFSWLLYIITIIHMKFQNADIFHFTWQLFGFSKLILKWNFKEKKVLTVHDPLSHSGNDSIEEEKLRIDSFHWADHFILLSQQLADLFAEKYGILKENISFSRLGCYDSYRLLANNVAQNINNSPYILFYGSIKKYKGIEYLLESMLSVHKSCPDLKLVVAGSGDFYFDVEKFKDYDFIEFRHKYLGIKEMVSLIKGAEFSVCPYTDATQSGVIQTCYSLGCPLVVTDVGNFRESVIDGKTGLIVPAKDINALAKAIISLHNNPETIDEMKENIRNYIENNMSWSPIADDYIRIYNKILR